MNTNDSDIKQILTDYSKIAVIGISENPTKPSQTVPLFMRDHGYSIVGINPVAASAIAGIPIYKTLTEVPNEFRRFVDVFRRPEYIPEVVDEVLAVGGVEVLWLQLGISHPEAEKRAERAGIKVVSNRCLVIEHRRLMN